MVIPVFYKSLLLLAGIALFWLTWPFIPVKVETVGTIDRQFEHEYERALRQVVRIARRELGSNFTLRKMQARLYRDDEAFKQGLSDGGLSESEVQLFTRTAVSFAYRGVILSNADKIKREKVRLTSHLGHEIVHLMQREWTRQNSGPQAVREGMAEVWSARWEEAAGSYSYQTFHEDNLVAVREKKAVLLTLPLSLNLEEWAELNERLGLAANGTKVLYAWAALLYEQLEIQSSPEALIEFLGLPKEGTDLENSFAQVLRVELADFEQDFRAYLINL